MDTHDHDTSALLMTPPTANFIEGILDMSVGTKAT